MKWYGGLFQMDLTYNTDFDVSYIGNWKFIELYFLTPQIIQDYALNYPAWPGDSPTTTNYDAVIITATDNKGFRVAGDQYVTLGQNINFGSGSFIFSIYFKIAVQQFSAINQTFPIFLRRNGNSPATSVVIGIYFRALQNNANNQQFGILVYYRG